MTVNKDPQPANQVSRIQRERMMGQKGKLIWFTGLPSSGKSTLATRLELSLQGDGWKTYLLDGDIVRKGLSKDLSFDEAGRRENIRRVGEVAALFVDAGIVVLCAVISPFETDREKVRRLVGADNFIEVFVDAPLNICEQRDVKGLYKQARRGLIKDFTGISSPYEPPRNPDVTIDTGLLTIEQSSELLLGRVMKILRT